MSFKEAELPRHRHPSCKLDNTTAEVASTRQYENFKRFYEYVYFKPSLEAIVKEMKSRFPKDSQETILALSDVLFSESLTEKNIDVAARFCCVDKELLMSDKAILKNMKFSDKIPDKKALTYE